MNACNVSNRTIFCKDNLDILAGIDSGCIDLIYLDPPFNKNKTFTAPVGSSAKGASFDDIFRQEDIKKEWLLTIREDHPSLYYLLEGIRRASQTSTFAYLAYMAIRLFECRRTLKETGSIWLHCDPTMSHYLKITMDCIFGQEHFLSDITWKRYAPHSLATSAVDTVSDHILYYARDKNRVFARRVTRFPDKEEMHRKFPHVEPETQRRYQHVALEQSSNKSSAGEARNIKGNKVTSDIGWRWSQKTFEERLSKNPHLIHWTGTGRPRYKIYADEHKGRPVGNVWTDIPYLSSGASERTGYPTQKPLALLERIIEASSNPGDMILDPFCGCATTCIAAERLDRKWIGIDKSALAYDLVRERLEREVDKPQADWIKGDTEVNMLTDPPRRSDRETDHREAKYVYVASNPKYPGEYKVGVAKNWKHRLNAYQTSEPDRGFRIEHTLRTPAFRETEKHIHSIFENKHEWVRGDLDEIIREINEYEQREEA